MSLTSINIYTLKQIRTERRRYDLEDYPITSPFICYKLLQLLLDLKSEPVEKFGIISLNTKNKITGIHIIGTGLWSYIKKWCQKFEVRNVKFEIKPEMHSSIKLEILSHEFGLLNIRTSNFF